MKLLFILYFFYNNIITKFLHKIKFLLVVAVNTLCKPSQVLNLKASYKPTQAAD